MSVNDASRIVIDESRLMLQIVASLTDDSKGVIYNYSMFIIQVTGSNVTKRSFVRNL
jgi:hypothetical protein